MILICRVRAIVPGGTIYTATGTDMSQAQTFPPPIFSWLVYGVPFASNYGSYQPYFFPGGYNGNGMACPMTELSQPMGIAVDSQLDVFIADNGNHLVRIANPNNPY